MNELELAIKYGVTTLEKSRELDWKSKTIYKWVRYKEFIGGLLVDEEIYESQKHLDIVEEYPAPQMHEIFPYLEGDCNADFLIDADTLWYDCNDDDAKEKYGEIQAFIYDNHIAEACAEIYIQLRNNNLLWKSPETNS